MQMNSVVTDGQSWRWLMGVTSRLRTFCVAVSIKQIYKQHCCSVQGSATCSASSLLLHSCTPAAAASACTFTFCANTRTHRLYSYQPGVVTNLHCRGHLFDAEVCEEITIDITMETVTRAWRTLCLLSGLVVLFQRYCRRHAGWATGITASAAGK